jgi:hypothetical protein
LKPLPNTKNGEGETMKINVKGKTFYTWLQIAMPVVTGLLLLSFYYGWIWLDDPMWLLFTVATVGGIPFAIMLLGLPEKYFATSKMLGALAFFGSLAGFVGLSVLTLRISMEINAGNFAPPYILLVLASIFLTVMLGKWILHLLDKLFEAEFSELLHRDLSAQAAEIQLTVPNLNANINNSIARLHLKKYDWSKKELLEIEKALQTIQAAHKGFEYAEKSLAFAREKKRLEEAE